MENLIKFDDVNNKIIVIRNQSVILDSDVATLYGVETRRINEAVKRNPDKFPDGYVFQLRANEFDDLLTLVENSQIIDNQNAVAICDRPMNINDLEKYRLSSTLPSAFTEKGLYMLATILKSPTATQTTIAIVEAFTKIRELSRAVVQLAEAPDDEQKQLSIMQKSGEILSDIIRNDLKTKSTETSFELNLLAMMKLKHTIKREAD